MIQWYGDNKRYGLRYINTFVWYLWIKATVRKESQGYKATQRESTVHHHGTMTDGACSTSTVVQGQCSGQTQPKISTFFRGTVHVTPSDGTVKPTIRRYKGQLTKTQINKYYPYNLTTVHTSTIHGTLHDGTCNHPADGTCSPCRRYGETKPERVEAPDSASHILS